MGSQSGTSLPGAGIDRGGTRVGALRRSLVMVSAAAIVLGACTDDAPAQGDATTASTAAPPTTPAPPTDDECDELAREAVAPLQDFVDDYDDLSFEAWNRLDPRPDVAESFDTVTARAEAAIRRGCDPTRIEGRMAEGIAAVDGESLVGKSIARAIRGEGSLYGPPAPVAETTVPQNLVPTTVTVRAGEPLGPVLARLAPGSTVRFAPGTHRFTESIVLERAVTFAGDPAGGTTLSSSAAGAALAFLGVEGFAVRDLTIEHVGDQPSSVVLVVDASVEIEGVTLTGATGAVDVGGGHGLVVGNGGLAGLSDDASAIRPTVVVSDSEIDGNEAAGLLVTGDVALTIDGSTITGNGSCGICATEQSTVEVRDAVLRDNRVGLQATDQADVDMSGVSVATHAEAGITAAGRAVLDVTEVTVEENGEVGLQYTGESAGAVRDATVRGHDVGVLVGDGAAVEIVASGIVGHEIGVQATGSASVLLTDSALWLSERIAVSLGEDSAGEIRSNRFDRADEVGVQVVGNADGQIVDNEFDGAGTIGISFLEDGSGRASGNRVADRDFGVQVGGSATVELLDNEVVGSTVVGILFTERASGAVERNEVDRDRPGETEVGLAVSGSASPRLVDNQIRRHSVGIVVRGTSTASSDGDVVDTNSIGIQILDDAAPTFQRFRVDNSIEAGIVSGGRSGGELIDGTLTSNGDVALSVADTAAPDIQRVVIGGPGRVGVAYAGRATGEFRANRVEGVDVGVRLGDDAVPQLYDNEFVSIATIAIAYVDRSGGEIRGNTCPPDLALGITVAATAIPNLADNDCVVVAA
ncbi:MAG: right-handed parallel beta-helix repeat-containing protein [Ilumatobacter sp.]|nr:right-handed parallel beta-helix repeat-containing protein [Ilumatobacter sp.]